MPSDELQIRLEAGIPGDMLDFPWELPLDALAQELLIPLPVDLSPRRPVRRRRRDGDGSQEINEELAQREFGLLRDLEELDIPRFTGGVVTGRRDAQGEPLPGMLVTEHLTWSIPTGRCTPGAFSANGRSPARCSGPPAGRLHLVGFAWYDCSLSNVLFRRDAGVRGLPGGRETGELHPRLTDGQRNTTWNWPI